jgi:2-oxoacid dehydrogenases acyltransferase (catalytic domain)
MSARRSRRRDRVAVATWSKDHEARVGLDLRLEWDRIRTVHPKLAPVAVVGYALAQAFAKNPLANRRVAIWSILSNPTVRLSFAVDVHNNLRIAVVDRADELAPRAFQQAMISATRDARNGQGPLGAATRVLESVPVVVSRPLLRLASAVTAGLGVGMLGIPGAPFGAAMISSLQRFGMPAVDVPFVPFTRCALVCSVGSIMPAVIARGGEAVVVDTVDIRFSYDHRICDGAQLAALLDDFLVASYGPSPNA